MSSTIPAYDDEGSLVSNGAVTVTIDKTTGVNGEKAYVTVTPTGERGGGSWRSHEGERKLPHQDVTPAAAA